MIYNTQLLNIIYINTDMFSTASVLGNTTILISYLIGNHLMGFNSYIIAYQIRSVVAHTVIYDNHHIQCCYHHIVIGNVYSIQLKIFLII